MKRVIGFAFFCAAIGMVIAWMMPETLFFRIMLFLGFMIAGYILFCNLFDHMLDRKKKRLNIQREY